MTNKKLSHLVASTTIVAATFFSTNAFAAGTEAGTAIQNTATVSFTRNGSADSEQASVSFKVDEIINVNVTAANASTNITNGDQNAAITYTVTNTGNGPEDFKLFESIGSTNDLPLAAANLSVYYIKTADSDGSFDPNNINETLYTSGTDITILSDESYTVYIVTNVPNGATLNSLTDLDLTVVSQTEANGVKAGESAFGTVIPGAGADSTNAIVAVNQGRDDATSELKVTTFDPSQSLEVLINKTILGSSAFIDNSPTVTDQKIPGAIVTYFIKVTVQNDTATALAISDIIPTNMTYVAESLRVQSAVNSTINTPTYKAPAVATKTPATYSNFTALTDINTDADNAETIPNTGTVDSIKVAFGDLAPGEYAILLDAVVNN